MVQGQDLKCCFKIDHSQIDPNRWTLDNKWPRQLAASNVFFFLFSLLSSQRCQVGLSKGRAYMSIQSPWCPRAFNKKKMKKEMKRSFDWWADAMVKYFFHIVKHKINNNNSFKLD